MGQMNHSYTEAKMIEVKDKIMDKMKENKDIIMRADD